MSHSLAVLFKHANFLCSSFERYQTSINKYELINMNETRGKPLKHTIVTYAPTFVKIYCTCFINVIFLSAFYKTRRVKIL